MKLLLRLLALTICVIGCSQKGKKKDAPDTEAPAAVSPAPTPAIKDSAPTIDDPVSTDGTKTEADARAYEPAVPFDYRHPVTFGPPGCPVLVVGDEVRDAKTKDVVKKLKDAYEPLVMRALSADGKYFAAASKSPNQNDTAVAVYATETGEKILEVPGNKTALVDVIAFGDGTLLVGGRHSKRLDVWDLATKKPGKAFEVPDRRVEGGKLAFDPDGKSFACLTTDKLIVTDIATGRATTLAAPGGRDVVFVYAWMGALSYSPDGTEIAGFTTHPAPRMIVWSTKGQVVLDTPVPLQRMVSHKHTLEWIPGGKGWLVNGYLIDRSSKRVAMSIRVPFASDVPPHLLNKDRVIGEFGTERDKLRTFTVPWDKLDASFKQMADKAPAFLAPGDAVSLEFELAGLRGEEAETKKILTDALTERLARDGITVAAGKPTVLKLKLSEQAGDMLPIVERQSAFDFRGKDTGRKATEAKGAAILEITAKGEKKPLWRDHLKAMSARSFEEEITDATVRKSMLEHLAKQLSGLDMPYFIPKAKDLVALPAVVE